MIFDRIIRLLDMSDPSDYEEYYENVSWKTFRIDESIWDENPHKRPKIGYFRQLQHCYQQLLEELSDSFLYWYFGAGSGNWKSRLSIFGIRNVCILNGRRTIISVLSWE